MSGVDPFMASSMGKNQHVVPRNGGWGVRGAGNSRDSGIFPTQQAAIERARQIARGQHSELVIHGRDGKIRGKTSYGRDPYALAG